MMSQNIEFSEEGISSDFEKITKNETISSENDSSSKEPVVLSDDSDSMLLTGIGIGIAIGIAIGIVSIVIIRQKSTK